MDFARNISLNILIEYDKTGVFPNLSLKKHLRTVSDSRDRSFITALVYGVIEKRLLLDYYIGTVSSVKIRKINVAVINILRMGLYQILFLSTPESAACNTSVELAKKNGQYKSAAFVNAILRKLSNTCSKLSISDNSLHIKYSIASCVYDKLVETLGQDGLIDFMEAPKESKKTYVAVNTTKLTSDQLISVLKPEGVSALPTCYSGLLELDCGLAVEGSAAFKSGLYHVVGLPSYACAKALSPAEKDAVIDMCAAPGGKTFVLAYLSNDNSSITAFDIHKHKIDNLNRDLKRLGLKSVTPELKDSSIFDEKLVNSADKILCDVPCSGLGMILKKPDIKYNDIDFKSLIDIQYKILSNAGKYLKHGGRIVYSTCTINRDENSGVVNKFICDNPEFRIDNSVEIFNGCFGEHTFLPHIDKTDGFYIAVLTKE